MLNLVASLKEARAEVILAIGQTWGIDTTKLNANEAVDALMDTMLDPRESRDYLGQADRCRARRTPNRDWLQQQADASAHVLAAAWRDSQDGQGCSGARQATR